ncbi:MAG TPA: hypothetical protein DEB17_08480 [Chlorobaculum sp.]|uniref:Uncharacterized protein n=1 Tax=Chlorobaculum tepidum (strain ATCC 49652 / DSM 12025 / NBRC 103806 / TLS) TaxID=194439 RepID=Q8KF06_CHLTE|nr:hypothetical protein CT0526 [Chlorobaculum tepidum TLS]HBU24006.1 hypothetical protein [Chlorobaculum sp.]
MLDSREYCRCSVMFLIPGYSFTASYQRFSCYPPSAPTHNHRKQI